MRYNWFKFKTLKQITDPVFQIEVFNALQMRSGPSKCNPKLKMKTSLEVLDIICPSSIVHTKIDQSNFIHPRRAEQRFESRESLPFLACYHLCPKSTFLDSPRMILSSKYVISFISITTHLNTKKYVRSICLVAILTCRIGGFRRDLLHTSRGWVGR